MVHIAVSIMTMLKFKAERPTKERIRNVSKFPLSNYYLLLNLTRSLSTTIQSVQIGTYKIKRGGMLVKFPNIP
jgi:hypothetical protein